jgi:hypothetical protein
MLAEQIDGLSVRVEPCAKDPSRFNWFVQHGQHVVRHSLDSLPSMGAALQAGRAALQEAADLGHNSHRPDEASDPRVAVTGATMRGLGALDR